MTAAGIANLAVFLVAFRAFVRTLVDNPLAPFWALLFALFAWGILPWRFSGFLGMNAIGFGLPYPSMFAMNVTLLSLCSLARFGVSRRPHWLLWFALGAVLVSLTHPLTSAALVIGSIALAVRYRIPMNAGELALSGGIVVAVGSLVAVWPGYSIVNLLVHEGGAYNNPVMYVRPIPRNCSGVDRRRHHCETKLPTVARSTWADARRSARCVHIWLGDGKLGVECQEVV